MISCRATIVILIGISLLPGSGDPRFTDWSVPEDLPTTNSSAFEFPGSISKDGLTLYFQRSPLPGSGEDMWIVHRETDQDPWGIPQRLPDTVNSVFNDRAPTISPDGHWLFFGSDRPGGLGGFDIWASWRPHIRDDAGWTTALNLGAPLNTEQMDSGPAFLAREDGTTQIFFTSARAGGLGATDIYVSTWNVDGSFTAPVLVPELNSSARDERPYLRHDGLELFMQSNRAGSQLFDIWYSTRESIEDVWSPPRNLQSVNSPANDNTPVISWDRESFFLGTGRAGTADVYVATRARIQGSRQ